MGLLPVQTSFRVASKVRFGRIGSLLHCLGVSRNSVAIRAQLSNLMPTTGTKMSTRPAHPSEFLRLVLPHEYLPGCLS